MKTTLIALLLVCSAAANAQRLVCNEPTIDVGKTGFNVPVTATFTLKNKSSRRLTLTGVRSDCGCARVDLPKKEISGGETFTIALTYDARLLGHFQRQAAVSYAGSDKPLWLTMKGLVLEEYVDLSKNYPYTIGHLRTNRDVVEFDDVIKGTQPQQSVGVYNNGSHDMTPVVMHLPPYLSAICAPEVLKPGQAGTLTLTLHSDKVRDYGLTQTSVYVGSRLGEKVKNDNEMPVSVVLLPEKKERGNGPSPLLHVSDTVVEVGLVDGKMHKSATVTLTNNGQAPLEIQSLQMFTRGLKLTLGERTLPPGGQTKLKIVADRAQLLKARHRPRVLMITNDAQNPKVTIQIHCK